MTSLFHCINEIIAINFNDYIDWMKSNDKIQEASDKCVLIDNDYVLILDNRLADRLLYILGMNYIACGFHYN